MVGDPNGTPFEVTPSGDIRYVGTEEGRFTVAELHHYLKEQELGMHYGENLMWLPKPGLGTVQMRVVKDAWLWTLRLPTFIGMRLVRWSSVSFDHPDVTTLASKSVIAFRDDEPRWGQDEKGESL